MWPRCLCILAWTVVWWWHVLMILCSWELVKSAIVCKETMQSRSLNSFERFWALVFYVVSQHCGHVAPHEDYLYLWTKVTSGILFRSSESFTNKFVLGFLNLLVHLCTWKWRIYFSHLSRSIWNTTYIVIPYMLLIISSYTFLL